jgi:hypothetical protein
MLIWAVCGLREGGSRPVCVCRVGYSAMADLRSCSQNNCFLALTLSSDTAELRQRVHKLENACYEYEHDSASIRGIHRTVRALNVAFQILF